MKNTPYKSTVETQWPFSLSKDGWYQLAPFGRFPIKDETTGKQVMQIIDQQAMDAILADFNIQSSAADFAGVLIDYDHLSHNLDSTTEAAGWILELTLREDGLWFKPRWSAVGESNLKAGCYRHISPVFGGIFINETEVRPMRLDRAGLTNDPNIKGMHPLSNRGGVDPVQISHQKKENKSMKRLLALLGLSADASEDSAVEALTTMKNRADESVTMKNRATTAETELATVKTASAKVAADAFCTKHETLIKNRDAVHAQFIKDPEGTTALFESMNAAPAGDGKVTTLHNRQDKQPGQNDEKTPDNAQQLETKVQEYKGQNRCTYNQAFEAVSRANPELLKPAASE